VPRHASMAMTKGTQKVVRLLLIFTILASCATSVAATEAEAEQPAPEPVAATEEPVAEPVPLDCTNGELLERIDAWSVDCVALWLENLGFDELKAAFMGNKVDGPTLKLLTMEKLAEDYGVSDEQQQKKIYYNLKDILRKDNYSGNTNHYMQMLMWVLPFGVVYYYLSLKYEKQIAKLKKRYQKWQDAKNPPKPYEAQEYDDGTNEWTSGMNADLGSAEKLTKQQKKERKDAKREAKKEAAAKEEPKKAK